MDIKSWTRLYLTNLKDQLEAIDQVSIQQAIRLLWQAYKKGRRIYVVGNGGSASTASHMACDFTKTILGHKGDAKWKAFKMIALTDNLPTITAWSNDTDYKVAFAKQLENLGQKGDLLIAISSSGNSANIIKCVEVAHELKMKVIGIAGFGGGKLAQVADVALTSSANEYGPVEDIQMVLNHLLISYFYQKLSLGN